MELSRSLVQPASALLSVHKEIECLPTRIPQLSTIISGFPRGAITEIFGKRSSGRTGLLNSILAESTTRSEICAVVDTTNRFDPASAATVGVALHRLIWIRCDGNAEHAMKAADLILHGGGFGVLALDLCDLNATILRKIPLSYWYRFRRAVEDTPTVLVVMGNEPNAKSCASLLLEMQKEQALWSGTPPFELLRGASLRVLPRKPARSISAFLRARALA